MTPVSPLTYTGDNRWVVAPSPSWRELFTPQRLWRQSFNSEPAVVGTQVSIRNQSYTIAGVTPYREKVFVTGMAR